MTPAPPEFIARDYSRVILSQRATRLLRILQTGC